MIIQMKSYPRAALVGNPSDGYYGKTIAFVFSNFWAEVILYESPELEILPQERDRSIYKNINGLYEDVKLFGYYGGIRLVKATIKKFLEYCRANRVILDNRNFTIRYQSNIPNRLGLAGSSAIITACMKALMAFYNIRIPRQLLANLVLAVETDELGISAGLQDRVAQAYEQPVYMDFDKTIFERQEYGGYEPFSARQLKNLYIAYRTDLSEGSEVFHNDIRARFDGGDEVVVEAMRGFADLTVQVKNALREGQFENISPLLDANFDLRCSIYEISSKNKEMVALARKAGASAKFTGSGGAIIGMYKDEAMFETLKATFSNYKIEVFKPIIVTKE